MTEWKRLHERMTVLNMLFTCFLPTLAAPGSLVFYLKAYKDKESV
jgi:hypothetical protein